MSVQLLNMGRIPVVEMETKSFEFISKQTDCLFNLSITFDTALWSYNQPLRSWEPIVESTHLICQIYQNSSEIVI